MLYRQLILWPWLAWALYWAIAALRTKKTRRREPFGARLSHVLPLVAGGGLVGGGGPPPGGLAGPPPAPPPPTPCAGPPPPPPAAFPPPWGRAGPCGETSGARVRQ